jgi:hypothetical protein
VQVHVAVHSHLGCRSTPGHDLPPIAIGWTRGNRQLNAVLHCIAITRLRLPGPGQTYYQRRRAQGNATGEAVHALKRRIARAVYRQLKLAEQRLATSYL